MLGGGSYAMRCNMCESTLAHNSRTSDLLEGWCEVKEVLQVTCSWFGGWSELDFRFGIGSDQGKSRIRESCEAPRNKTLRATSKITLKCPVAFHIKIYQLGELEFWLNTKPVIL